MEDKNEKGNVGEHFVNQIAYKSLLKYWCYPNPLDEFGDKKEICDLLILFRNVCIIISVKNYKFDGNYEKYNRKTIEKAVRQIFGAERKLFSSSKEIHIKHPDRPVEIFKKEKYDVVFRIIVNLGEGLEMYDPALISETDRFITIFDKDTFKFILNALDTISDFTYYLEQREVFIRSFEEMHWLNYEKDIFAFYLKNGKSLLSDNPDINEVGMLILALDGYWDSYYDEYKDYINNKNEADKISYFFDELLEKELTKVENGDLLAQEFLALNRFQRRTFAKLFFDFLNMYNGNKEKTDAFRYVELDEYAFVFFYYSPDYINSYFPDYGLQTAMIGNAIRNDYPKKRMLGLGVTSEMQQFKFKFIDLNLPIEKIMIDQAQEAIKELGWFKNMKFKHHRESEYPKD